MKSFITLGPDHLQLLLRYCDSIYQCLSLLFCFKKKDVSYMSRDARKLVFWVSDHVRHKWACTVTEDGYKLEISDLRRSGIFLSV